MNDIEPYQNLIEFLKQALKFYANETTYNIITKIGDREISPIMNDRGSQARFALEGIEKFNELTQELNEVQNIEESLNDLLKAEPNAAAFLKIIENYQKMDRIAKGDREL